jgi:hypothetical protein
LVWRRKNFTGISLLFFFSFSVFLFAHVTRIDCFSRDSFPRRRSLLLRVISSLLPLQRAALFSLPHLRHHQKTRATNQHSGKYCANSTSGQLF